MTALMATLTTSMGLIFSLDWKERKSEGSGELDTAHLVTLLNKDPALLTPEGSKRVLEHFRNRVNRAREEAHVQGMFCSTYVHCKRPKIKCPHCTASTGHYCV